MHVEVTRRVEIPKIINSQQPQFTSWPDKKRCVLMWMFRRGTKKTTYFLSICLICTLGLIWCVCVSYVCVCVCTFTHLSSFLFGSPSHVVLKCKSLERWLQSEHTFPSVISERLSATSPKRRLWPAEKHLSAHVLTCARVSSSVHRAGNVWNCVASEILQLQQEGPLPVGKQLQQHRVRVQAQRHAHAHVGQQGDVCVKEEQRDVCTLL